MDRLLFARFFRASFSKGAKRSEESSEKILQDPSFRRSVVILIEEKNLGAASFKDDTDDFFA